LTRLIQFFVVGGSNPYVHSNVNVKIAYPICYVVRRLPVRTFCDSEAV